MTGAIYTSAFMMRHETGAGHPERAARLKTLLDLFARPAYKPLVHTNIAPATTAQIATVHPHSYINSIIDRLPESGIAPLDNGDTILSEESFDAAALATGCGLRAVEDIASGAVKQAFCAVRPPGHHAERHMAMGFCLFNTVAVMAAIAQDAHSMPRVAIIDFDIHHGNGTEDWVRHSPREGLFFASTHQSPFYPHTGDTQGNIPGRILDIPLPEGTTGAQLLAYYEGAIADALRAFKPDLLVVSAGFDAHVDDPLGGFKLSHGDFGALGVWSRKMADALAGGRVAAVLEGGYNLDALARSVEAHVRVLADL